MRFIEPYKVVLLDMMGTFMFQGDFFGEGVDYAATYRALGGGSLGGAQVCAVVGEVFRRMDVDYGDPSRQEDFGAVREYLEEVLEEFGLAREEAAVLDEVFAVHESGRVPETHARALRRLRETHRLGVVSNLWSPCALSLAEFRRAGVAELFETVVFSSDCRVNKPSPLIFRRAVKRLGVGESEVVFVGNDLARDVGGAKAVGMAAVWIDADGSGVRLERAAPELRPDLVIRDLRELLEA